MPEELGVWEAGESVLCSDCITVLELAFHCVFSVVVPQNCYVMKHASVYWNGLSFCSLFLLKLQNRTMDLDLECGCQFNTVLRVRESIRSCFFERLCVKLGLFLHKSLQVSSEPTWSFLCSETCHNERDCSNRWKDSSDSLFSFKIALFVFFQGICPV